MHDMFGRIRLRSLVIVAAAFFGGSATVAASGPCTFLTGAARAACLREEARARSEQNRAAAEAAHNVPRDDRQSRDAPPRTDTRGSAPAGPQQRWGEKPSLADPPVGHGITVVNDRYNKDQAIAWANSNDPGNTRLRSEIANRFPLWLRAKAIPIISGTTTITPGRFPGELDITYAGIGSRGARFTNTLQAQMVRGRLCLGNGSSLYHQCDDLPASAADADRLYAATMAANAERAREVERDRAETAAVIAGSRTRRPGSPLNAEDEACLKTFSETYTQAVEGQCVSGYYTRLDNGSPGPFICTKHSGGTATSSRSYEKNVCSRAITFRDQCGTGIFAVNTVQPGARFDRKFSYPCGRVY